MLIVAASSKNRDMILPVNNSFPGTSVSFSLKPPLARPWQSLISCAEMVFVLFFNRYSAQVMEHTVKHQHPPNNQYTFLCSRQSLIAVRPASTRRVSIILADAQSHRYQRPWPKFRRLYPAFPQCPSFNFARPRVRTFPFKSGHEEQEGSKLAKHDIRKRKAKLHLALRTLTPGF